jgi:hypothetical protein
VTEGIWIALIGLAGVAFGSLGLWFGRRKLKAEAAQIVTETALSLIEPLKERITALEQHAEELHAGIEKLTCQLVENGLTPVWTPPPFDRNPTRPNRKSRAQ